MFISGRITTSLFGLALGVVERRGTLAPFALNNPLVSAGNNVYGGRILAIVCCHERKVARTKARSGAFGAFTVGQRSADEPDGRGLATDARQNGPLLEAFGDGAPPTGTESLARPFARQDADYEAV